MTPAELTAIQARADAATDGPWERTGTSSVRHHHSGIMVATAVDFEEQQRAADADFIAAARTDVTDLVAEVRRLQAALAQVETAAASELTTRAKQAGAEQAFVTAEGYTLLPEAMQRELATVGTGAHIWFLRKDGVWEAWPEQKLADYLA